MALPLAPIAFAAARYGTVAAAVWMIARNRRVDAPDYAREKAMDDAEEGWSLGHRRDPLGVDAEGTARWRRVIRIGAAGPGLEIDATAISRLRIRKV